MTELEKIKESMERMSLDNSAKNSMEIYNEVDEQKNYVLRVEPVTYSNNYNWIEFCVITLLPYT